MSEYGWQITCFCEYNLNQCNQNRNLDHKIVIFNDFA